MDLTRLVHSKLTSIRLLLCARIVLLAAESKQIKAIAARLSLGGCGPRADANAMPSIDSPVSNAADRMMRPPSKVDLARLVELTTPSRGSHHWRAHTMAAELRIRAASVVRHRRATGIEASPRAGRQACARSPRREARRCRGPHRPSTRWSCHDGCVQ